LTGFLLARRIPIERAKIHAMKYAIISDIHANLEALNAALADIHALNITHIACLGDIVGHGPNPKECLDIIRALNIPCVKGNHDEYCSNDEPLPGMIHHAMKAVEWMRKQLTAEDRQWLADLKYSLAVANFTIVHGSLDARQSVSMAIRTCRWRLRATMRASGVAPIQNSRLIRRSNIL
jgi:predicted phosphodiesterase